MKLNDGLTVGDRVRNRRIELGLMQDELAARAGYCGKSAISKLEHEGNHISMKQVRRLADAMDCSMEYLMGWKESPNINVQDSSINSSDIPAAIELYSKFMQASPSTQVAIDLLLSNPQSGASLLRLKNYIDEQNHQDS